MSDAELDLTKDYWKAYVDEEPEPSKENDASVATTSSDYVASKPPNIGEIVSVVGIVTLAPSPAEIVILPDLPQNLVRNGEQPPQENDFVLSEQVAVPISGERKINEEPPSQSSKQRNRRFSRRAIFVGLGIVGLGSLGYWLSHNEFARILFEPQSTPIPRTGKTPTPIPTSTTSSSKLLYTYPYFSSEVRVVAWSPNGKYLVAGSNDHTAQVWDALTGTHFTTYQGHSDYVEGVSWSPDNTRIVSGSADGTVQIWHALSGAHIFTYHGHEQTFSASSYQTHAWVNRVGWSPDGKYIVSGDQTGDPTHIATVQVWEANSGKALVIFKNHASGVFSASWSSDSKRIASCGYDGTLQIWDAFSGQVISSFLPHKQLYGLSWSPDGFYVAVGGDTSFVWILEAATGEIALRYNTNAEQVTDTAWSLDGMHIACCTRSINTLQIFDIGTGQTLSTTSDPTGVPTAICWSPDTKTVCSGNDVAAVTVWQALY